MIGLLCLSVVAGAPEDLRAVVGLNDPSARRIVRQLGKDLVTIALPYALFQQMEDDVEGGFLQGDTWAGLQDEIDA